MSDDELIEAMRQAWLDAPFYEGELMLDSDLRAMRAMLDVVRAHDSAELAALRIENDALRAEREKLLGCRDELREIAEAISDPRIHNTMTIAEWCREASALMAAPSDLSLTGLSAFNDVLGHNYWMEATTFARLRRRIVEHWRRAALGD